MNDYFQRLRGDLISEGTPYGFTLIIWGSGAIATKIYGSLTVGGVFLFIAAPAVVYGILIVLLERVFSDISSPPKPVQSSPGVAYIDLWSVLPAVACAYGILVALPNQYEGLPAASGTAMLVYNLLLAAQRSLFCEVSDSSDD